MDTELPPESESPQVTRHRRRHSSAWKRTPRWVKISMAVCLGLLVLSAVLQDRIMDLMKSGRPPETSKAAESVAAARVEVSKTLDSITAKLAPIDLELEGTSLNGATRTIEGVVKNKSDHPYSNIRIEFALPTPDLRAQDSAIVTIARLAPHASVKFVSDRVPDGVRQWALVGITATPK